MNKLQRSEDGMFLTSSNPSPVMQAAMDSIRHQLQAEAQRRDRIRSGQEPADDGQWGSWNISDRH